DRRACLTDAAAGRRNARHTLLGYKTLNAAGERLLTDEIFNTVLVLLVVTSLLGPVLMELFTPRMEALYEVAIGAGSRLGRQAQAMVTRFMGLIVASMGMQFALTGLKAFFG